MGINSSFNVIAGICGMLFLLSGCSATENTTSDSQTQFVYQHLAFKQDIDRVYQAYKEAAYDMDLRIAKEENDRMEVYTNNLSPYTRIKIKLSLSDTLETEAMVTSDVVGSAGNFIHYPYQLSGRAAKLLDPSYQEYPYVFPQVIYPAHKHECKDPSVYDDEEVEAPVLKGGTEAITQQLTYTSRAIDAGTEGRVYVEAVIGENGRVSCAMIGAGLPNGLNENALASVVRTEFEPGRYQGEPVAMKVIIPLIFRFR